MGGLCVGLKNILLYFLWLISHQSDLIIQVCKESLTTTICRPVPCLFQQFKTWLRFLLKCWAPFEDILKHLLNIDSYIDQLLPSLADAINSGVALNFYESALSARFVFYKASPLNSQSNLFPTTTRYALGFDTESNIFSHSGRLTYVLMPFFTK